MFSGQTYRPDYKKSWKAEKERYFLEVCTHYLYPMLKNQPNKTKTHKKTPTNRTSKNNPKQVLWIKEIFTQKKELVYRVSGILRIWYIAHIA